VPFWNEAKALYNRTLPIKKAANRIVQVAIQTKKHKIEMPIENLLKKSFMSSIGVKNFHRKFVKFIYTHKNTWRYCNNIMQGFSNNAVDQSSPHSEQR
jgi:hypothetical protein